MNTLQLLYFANTPNGTNCYSCIYFYLFLLQYWSIWNIQAISSGINSISCPYCPVQRILIHFWVLFTVILSFSSSIPRVGGKKLPHWFKCSLTFWSKLPFTEPSMLPPWLPASRWQLKHSRTVALSVQQFGIQKKKRKIGVLIFWRRAQEKARLWSWPIELPSVIRVTRQIFCE